MELRAYFTRVDRLIPRIAGLVAAAREAGVPVLRSRIASATFDGRDVGRQHRELQIDAALGSREAQLVKKLRPALGDVVLDRTCTNPFEGTSLDTVLRAQTIDTLIVCGLLTNGGVEDAIRMASGRGYRTILVQDACTSITPSLHRAAVRGLRDVYCNSRSTASIRAELVQMRQAARVNEQARAEASLAALQRKHSTNPLFRGEIDAPGTWTSVYHFTADVCLDAISREGLRPRARRDMHLLRRWNERVFGDLAPLWGGHVWSRIIGLIWWVIFLVTFQADRLVRGRNLAGLQGWLAAARPRDQQ